MKRFSRKSLVIIVLLSLAVIIAGTGAAAASGAQVTRGDVHTFALGASLGYDVSGRAQMVRTADGRTITFVEVWGLKPNTDYLSHVHKLPCGDPTAADGHYQNVPSPTGDPINEIWLNFTTDASGHGNGHATNDFTARPEAQAVVIHEASGAKIACADLQ